MSDTEFTPHPICTASTQYQSMKLEMYVDYLERGMDLCSGIAAEEPYPGENLSAVSRAVEEQRLRLRKIFAEFESRMAPVPG